MSTPRTHSFRTPEPIEAEIRNPAGDVRVTADGQGETRVELTPLRGDRGSREAVDKATVEFADGRLRVVCESRVISRGHRIGVSVTLPSGSSVRAVTASADLTVLGRIDSLDGTTASGDVRVEDVDGEARVRTASGDIALRAVTGDARVRTGSGDLKIGRAETLRFESASGDVTVRELAGSAEFATASGDLDIGRIGQGELVVRTASGDVTIGIAEGALAHLSLSTVSGSVRNELPVEDAGDAGSSDSSGKAVLDIRARTVSGDIRIGRASASQSA